MNPHLRYAQAIKGRVTGQGRRHHRHDPPRRSRSRRQLCSEPGRAPALDRRGPARLVRQVPDVDDDARVRHRRTRSEEQSRRRAGSCRSPSSRATRAAPISGDFCRDRYRARARAESGRARWKLSGGAAPHEAVRLFALQPRRDGHGLPDPVDAGRTSGRSRLPTAEASARPSRSCCRSSKTRERWPYQPDVMYYDEWPMRHAALLFGAQALQVPRWESVWRRLQADSNVEEVIRNFFVRQPLLWSDLSQP